MSTNKILSYDLAPSPSTIFGCLLPAPWLGVVAGLLLAFGPAAAVPDRFSPLVLACTHVLVLGMLAPMMIGALFQLLPVVGGQFVSGSKWVAPFVVLGSAGVALGLSIGFLRGERVGFVWAVLLAVPLYGAVILVLARAGWRMLLPAHADASLTVLRWISAALALTIGLGIALAGSFAGWWQLDVLAVLQLHVAWGGVGWIAALLLGIASTVVPMFWQTSKPSVHWQRWVPGVLWLLLAGMTLFAFSELAHAWSWLLALLIAALAVLALFALSGAKRRFDPAWILWVGCALSWLLCALIYLLGEVVDVKSARLASAISWWIGVLALVGGAVFPVNAMLGKIIPFLVFLHLRRQIAIDHAAPKRIPTMQEIILPQHLRWQARLLILSLCLLLLLPLFPKIFLPIAGISFAVSQALLASLLLRALFRYRRELRKALFVTSSMR